MEESQNGHRRRDPAAQEVRLPRETYGAEEEDGAHEEHGVHQGQQDQVRNDPSRANKKARS